MEEIRITKNPERYNEELSYLKLHPFVIKLGSKQYYNSDPTFEQIIDFLKEKD